MKICVVGAGYVGLTLSAALASIGHDMICTDKDVKKIGQLKKGVIPFYEPGLSDAILRCGNLSFSSEVKSSMEECPVIFIAVGTPPRSDGSADTKALQFVIGDLSEAIRSYKTIITKSTVPPGTNENIAKQLIASGVSKNLFNIVSNPEFLREGNALYDMLHPDKTVIGVQEEDHVSAAIVKSIYKHIDTPFIVTSLAGAELIKYANNFFLAAKISFINEMARICEAYQSDISDISRAIGLDPRIGKHFLQAGIGYGGSCFPKDLQALQFAAQEKNTETFLLRAVQHINDTQLGLYIKKIQSFFETLQGKKAAVLGISFKPNTDDIRNSQAVRLMERLAELGCDVHAYDPEAVLPEHLRQHVTQHSQAFDAIEESDFLFLATEWPEFLAFDWKKAADIMKGRLVIDGRNVLKKELIEACGLICTGVGRP
ncbi:UDP-glucose/GDP-mannose dehydrogenase family protein [Bacillus subtilis]|uniref:UDP-glucose dehydrogenase family protein n=1 Tax=Bacillus subtilis TaxID=1423 RepID=UPI001C226D2F|nr:UDP-glucose/GDP-mannose dehydrogenase family protein [Bacillus subtilis]MBU8677277.1 UDP-glucose/GDP-mannose dehydrogenase family protein [Bacillus subtilis]